MMRKPLTPAPVPDDQLSKFCMDATSVILAIADPARALAHEGSRRLWWLSSSEILRG
jgi:hypothetical protein